jgi:eukaryotic-like serine/threonine-protein kinase
MVVVNESGRIVLVNAQLERLFGFTRGEMLGQPIEMLVPEEHRARHPEYVARFMAAPDFRPMASNLKLFGRSKEGRVFPAEISLSPVRTEQGLLVSCAVRDLTRRNAEERHG